jgi:hypothetical protein
MDQFLNDNCFVDEELHETHSTYSISGSILRFFLEKRDEISKLSHSGEEILVPDNHPTLTSINGILYDNNMKLLACPGGKKNVVLAEGIISVADYAFAGTLYLTNTDFLKDIATLLSGTNKLFYRSNITSAVLPTGMTEIPHDMFYKCYYLSSVTIPEGVTTVRGGCFSHTALETVTLPSTLTNFNYTNDAFYKISTLKELHCKAVNAPWMSEGVIVFGGGSQDNCTLYVPAGSLNSYKNANVWKDFKNIVEE